MQAVTHLAVERDTPFSANQLRTLDRYLNNAIADVVTEFFWGSDGVEWLPRKS